MKPPFFQRFLSRDAPVAVQFLKYGAAGAVASCVQVLLFYLSATLLFPALTENDPVFKLLNSLGLDAPAADAAVRGRNAALGNVVGFVFSNMTAYVLNVLWVFTPGRHGRLVEIGLFYAVSGASLVIGTGIVVAMIEWFDASTTGAFIANVFVSVAVNFIMRKLVVFKK